MVSVTISVVDTVLLLLFSKPVHSQTINQIQDEKGDDRHMLPTNLYQSIPDGLVFHQKGFNRYTNSLLSSLKQARIGIGPSMRASIRNRTGNQGTTGL